MKAARRFGKGKVGRVFLFAAALLLAAAFLLPTLLTLADSFFDSQEIRDSYGLIFEEEHYVTRLVELKFLPERLNLTQYSELLRAKPDYFMKLWNSVVLVVPIVLFQMAVASLAAYGFARWRSRSRELVFFVYIILMLMPYQVTLVPNYLVAHWTGILDTRWAVWLPAVASPFSVYLLTKNMRRISSSYVEAAKLDGAGEWKIFFRIFLPMSRSILWSVLILVFIDYWNMVEQPLILLQDTSLHPLSVYLGSINKNEIGVAFAAATLYMIPPLLLFLTRQKELIAGIVSYGGLKG